jgi:CheY-like chemotaxis protein
LATQLAFVAEAPELTRGNLLRRTLCLSIEALDPGAGVPPSLPQGRPYHILRGRYLLGESLEEVAAQLGISRRQAFRELKRAVEALAEILWDSGTLRGERAQDEPLRRLQAEVERLALTSRQEVDLGELVGGAVEGARRLAGERALTVELSLESSDLRVPVNRVMLRQAILNLLSHAVRAHQGGRLPVCLRRSGEQALIQLTYRPGPDATDATRSGEPYAVATQLLQTLGVDWGQEGLPDGSARISLRIPLTEARRLLVIDDNEGLIRLFERYLEGQPYRIFSATSLAQAFDMLSQLEPQVVILDVMMPERDGWEVLESLRQSEPGRRARVLVCAIINDPQLAAAMGADGFLHKPVDRAGLLHALERLDRDAGDGGGEVSNVKRQT